MNVCERDAGVFTVEPRPLYAIDGTGDASLVVGWASCAGRPRPVLADADGGCHVACKNFAALVYTLDPPTPATSTL